MTEKLELTAWKDAYTEEQENCHLLLQQHSAPDSSDNERFVGKYGICALR